jgi:hypothetical protein
MLTSTFKILFFCLSLVALSANVNASQPTPTQPPKPMLPACRSNLMFNDIRPQVMEIGSDKPSSFDTSGSDKPSSFDSSVCPCVILTREGEVVIPCPGRGGKKSKKKKSAKKGGHGGHIDWIQSIEFDGNGGGHSGRGGKKSKKKKSAKKGGHGGHSDLIQWIDIGGPS